MELSSIRPKAFSNITSTFLIYILLTIEACLNVRFNSSTCSPCTTLIRSSASTKPPINWILPLMKVHLREPSRTGSNSFRLSNRTNREGIASQQGSFCPRIANSATCPGSRIGSYPRWADSYPKLARYTNEIGLPLEVQAAVSTLSNPFCPLRASNKSAAPWKKQLRWRTLSFQWEDACRKMALRT